jgi:hypothetical protein
VCPLTTPDLTATAFHDRRGAMSNRMYVLLMAVLVHPVLATAPMLPGG